MVKCNLCLKRVWWWQPRNASQGMTVHFWCMNWITMMALEEILLKKRIILDKVAFIEYVWSFCGTGRDHDPSCGCGGTGVEIPPVPPSIFRSPF